MSPQRVALLSAKPDHCPKSPCRFHGLVPEGVVYVGRSAPGLTGQCTVFCNPYTVKRWGLAASREMFRDLQLPKLRPYLPDIRGRDLACWCPLDAEWCHADDLLAEANR